MKALTCEMCGSTNIVKEGGLYVCQSCGTKYSVEEARKMMVEGTVDVKGTVKVDTTEELKNLYKIARRAKDSNNYGDAAKYYEMIIIKEPNDWEACFYAPYFKTMDSDIDNISIAASNINNNIKTVLSLIKNNLDKVDDIEEALSDVTNRLIHIGKLLYHAAKENYRIHAKSVNAANNCAEDLIEAGRIGYTLGDCIVDLFGKGYYESLVKRAWSYGINCNDDAQRIFRKASGSFVSPNNAIAQTYRNKLSSLSPDTKVENNPKQNKGCIVLLGLIISPIIALLSLIICIFTMGLR